MTSSSERRKWGQRVGRFALAVALLWAAAAWLTIAIFSTTDEGTSGCEDGGSACRTADPAQAVIEGSVALVGISALLVAAIWQFIPRGTRLGKHRKIGARAATVGVAALAVWVGLIYIDEYA